MRRIMISVLILGLLPMAACAPDAPMAPDRLAPEDALFSRSSKTDKDANFRYDENNDGWYCVKSEPGSGPMYTDNTEPDSPEDEDTIQECPKGYTLQKEL